METNFPLLEYNFQKARLLIVEDNDDMWTITRFALRKEFPELQLDRVASCKQALTYLTTCIEENRPLPKLILQDLYMPDREEGLSLLRAVRQQLAAGSWPQLPIVITSSSSDPNDIQACYQHGASSYIVKPSNPSSQSSIFQAVRRFWWETSVLPLT
ncbi:MAG TPA: response regulator [Fibrella sp.]|jgi:CheY-like chemotaxis protein